MKKWFHSQRSQYTKTMQEVMISDDLSPTTLFIIRQNLAKVISNILHNWVAGEPILRRNFISLFRNSTKNLHVKLKSAIQRQFCKWFTKLAWTQFCFCRTALVNERGLVKAPVFFSPKVKRGSSLNGTPNSSTWHILAYIHVTATVSEAPLKATWEISWKFGAKRMVVFEYSLTTIRPRVKSKTQSHWPILKLFN